MSAQEPRYPNSGTDGHATLLAAWKGVCYVTECEGGGDSEERKRKMSMVTQYHLL